MSPDEAYQLVLLEGRSSEGMVIQVRGGVVPSKARVKMLVDALRVLRTTLAGAASLDRLLADSLYGLSFHMSNSVANLIQCDWLPEYSEMLLLIEWIFEDS